MSTEHEFAALSREDIRAVYEIVRAVCDRWDDPMAWRTYLLEQTCAMLDGHVGSIAGQSLSADGTFSSHSTPLAVIGLPKELQLAVFESALKRAEGRTAAEVDVEAAPGIESLFALFRHRGWATAARSELTDDSRHYASAFHREFRSKVGCDDYVMSVRLVDVPGRIEVLTIDRPPAHSRFTQRDVGVVRLLHDEIAPLVGVRLTTEEHLSRNGLSKRLNEVLTLLLEGLSEKSISRRLDIGASTVHEYVGLLYRHFRVKSRAQLMAYFVRHTPRAK